MGPREIQQASKPFQIRATLFAAQTAPIKKLFDPSHMGRPMFTHPSVWLNVKQANIPAKPSSSLSYYKTQWTNKGLLLTRN